VAQVASPMCFCMKSQQQMRWIWNVPCHVVFYISHNLSV
jgi:hypothetical protein